MIEKNTTYLIPTDGKAFESLDISNIPYDTFLLGSGKKRKRYVTIDFNFDVETTSTTINGERVAWVYHYQFCFNKVVYSGRYLSDFKLTLDKINEWACDNNVYIICLVHNLSYEFHFLTEIITFDTIFATASHNPIKAVYKHIDFRCTYAFTNMSLSLLAKSFTTLKKMEGDLDYRKVRYPWSKLSLKELQYCYYDCSILSDFWYNHIIPNYVNITKPWMPLTNTAKVRQDMRRRLPNWKAYKKAYTSIYPSEKIYRLLRLCFYGGVVRANALYTGHILSDVASRDRTSSYPAVQLHYTYPLTRFKHVIPTKILEYNHGEYAIMYHVIYKDIKACKDLSVMPINKAIRISKETTYDNGRIYKTKLVEMWVTEIDFDIYKTFYKGMFKIVDCYVSKKYRLPRFQIESLFDYYKGKKQLKGVKGMEEEYLKSKNMLNSNFGCCVQKHNDYEWVFDGTDWVKNPMTYKEGSSEFLLYQVGVWITAYARMELLSTADKVIKAGGSIYYMDTDSLKYSYNGGLYEHIFESENNRIEKLTKEACEYYNIDFEIVKEIGTWDLETKDMKGNVYSSFKYLGSKRYLSNGIPTVSGLPKKAWGRYLRQQCPYFFKVFKFHKVKIKIYSIKCKLSSIKSKIEKYSLSLFKDGVYISPDISGKLHMTYQQNGNVFEIKRPDGTVWRTPIHYVHAEDISFSMNLSSDYRGFLKMIQTRVGERSDCL